MTMKWKIIAGFIVMILVTGIVAAIGYFSLSSATNAFNEYRRLARLNVRTSDIAANQFSVTSDVRMFRLAPSPESIKSALEALKNNQAIIEESKKLTARQESRDALIELEKNIKDQMGTINALQNAVTATLHHYETEMRPAARELSQALVGMTKTALLVPGNEEIINTFAVTLDHLAACRASFGRLAASRTQALATESAGMLAIVGKDIERIRLALQTEKGREQSAVLEQAYDKMTAASAAMRESALDNIQQANRMFELNAHIAEVALMISADINTQMTEQGTRTLEVNATAQKSALAVTAAGLFIGILLTALTIIGLVRVLRGMSGFAEAIANGDFQAQVNSREKGEVGQTLAAMRQIPQVLERLITTMKASTGKILVGEYRTRIDAASFSGSFMTLAGSVNTVCDAYTKTLDLMPLAIFTGDSNKKMLYSNELTQKVLGGENVGHSCGSCLNTAKCNTNECFAVRAIQEKRNVSGEVQIKPSTGASLDFMVAALPLFDEAGTPRGFMEICSDITESKQRQRTISSVTEQAASISSRMAAASEELAAQVEQVSRGAETQRSRVESTASAMTEMNSTVLEVARNAGQASEQSDLTRNKANDGATLVGDVVQSINLVNRVASTLQTNMQELGAKAESIGGVMNVISDIADQTNLLALNAAIEAARAGDAGRGFAVVADEVRKLAEKTMAATQEVGSNITAIQHSTRSNIEEVNSAARAVIEATELANNSGQALTEIVTLASANSSVVASIATAAEEQSATSEEINRAIEEINQIVGETTDGMIQSSAAVQELALMAQELNTVMTELQQ